MRVVSVSHVRERWGEKRTGSLFLDLRTLFLVSVLPMVLLAGPQAVLNELTARTTGEQQCCFRTAAVSRTLENFSHWVEV